MSHGRHIKILGRGNPSLLGNGDAVSGMLTKLVDLLGMRMLGGTHMYEVEVEISKLGQVPFEDEGGVTGICVLSTSHCSIHTWPVRPFFVMDVYSCRDFDTTVVEDHLMSALGAYDIQVTDVSEALHYRYEKESAAVHATA